MKRNLNYPENCRFPDMQVIPGFDRVTFWSDSAVLPISEADLEKHCAKAEVTFMQMPFNAQLKNRITLFQPTTACFSLLKQALGYDITVQVTYVEVAYDLLATSQEEARAIKWPPESRQ